MSLNFETDDEKRAFDSGWRVGALTIFYEIQRLRNRCEWPEDLEVELDEWIDNFENGRRFIK